MIKKVILKNWRSHENTELEFSEGTNVLVGRMGSGKSSVLNAICFAFFGTFPEIQTRKIKLDDIIMKKPKQKDEAIVSIEFVIGEDLWNVTRKIIKGKGTIAELRKNGILIESPQPTRVTEVIENILKMNYDIFVRAVYSEQNAIDMFLTLPKNQRREKIDELLKLDKFEIARINTLEIERKLKTILEEKRKTYEIIILGFEESKIEELKKEIQNYEMEIKNINIILNDTKRENEKIIEEINKLRTNEKKIISLEENYRNISKQIESLDIEISKLVDKTKEISFKNIEEQLKVLKEEKIKLENKKIDLKNKIEAEQKILDEYKRSLGRQEAILIDIKQKFEEKRKYFDYLKKNNPVNIEAEYIVKNDKIMKLNFEISKLKVDIEQLLEAIENLKNMKSNCPVCDSLLDEKYKIEIKKKKEAEIIEKKKKLSEYENKLKVYLSEIEELEKIRKEAVLIKNKFDELLGIEEKYEKICNDIDSLNKKIDYYEKSIYKMKNDFNELDQNIKKSIEKIYDLTQKLEIFILISEKEKHKNNLIENKKNIEAELVNLKSNFDKTKLEKYEENVREISKKIGELTAKNDNIIKLISDKNKQLSEFEKRKQIIYELKEEIKNIEIAISKINILEECLKNVQNILRETFIENINSVMSVIWPNLYPYKDYFNARLRIDENDYILELEDNNGWIQVEGVASGGERAIACLVLRMAFAYALAPGLNCLVLDEPTHNLDSNAINELSNVLRERLSEYIQQIFVITHEPSLESAATGYLYRFDRNKAENEPTKIELIE